jgi:hypothetical protein
MISRGPSSSSWLALNLRVFPPLKAAVQFNAPQSALTDIPIIRQTMTQRKVCSKVFVGDTARSLSEHVVVVG